MTTLAAIKVGPYELSPITEVRQDNLYELFGDRPGVYVCNSPVADWYKKFGGRRSASFSVDKKRCMFGHMAHGSAWISPTFDAKAPMDSTTWDDGAILHFGTGVFRGRMAQMRQTLAMAIWLVLHSSKYDYCLAYNFDLPYYFAPLFVKVFLRKRLLVDYEDDFTLLQSSKFKKMLGRFLHKSADGAICVNESMVTHFNERQDVRVLNCFADLRYAKVSEINLREGMVFLYSGRLDDVRGVDLVPDLVKGLREKLIQFSIRITGDGPLRREVELWTIPEVKYLGFLDDEAFAQEIMAADACLILQRPDHPLSRGTYPSKIESYARHRKPIFMIRLPQNAQSKHSVMTG